jgi:hypothetical protein
LVQSFSYRSLLFPEKEAKCVVLLNTNLFCFDNATQGFGVLNRQETKFRPIFSWLQAPKTLEYELTVASKNSNAFSFLSLAGNLFFKQALVLITPWFEQRMVFGEGEPRFLLLFLEKEEVYKKILAKKKVPIKAACFLRVQDSKPLVEKFSVKQNYCFYFGKGENY